jgi:two-component system LytT family sensor kinase
MYSRKILARSLVTATAIAGFSSLRMMVEAFSRGGSIVESERSAAIGFLYLYLWAFQVPLLARFFTRYPLAERPWRYPLYYAGVGLVASFVTVTLNGALVYFVRRWILIESAAQLIQASNNMQRGHTAELIGGFVIFWIIAAVFQTVEARQRAHALQGRLAQAELQNLKSQLHPHFLFNTLHTISVLMRQDVELSNRLLLKLSELLRASLDHSRADRITLQQELDFLENYLSIEQARFEERLRVSIAADPEARAALIPTLLLQPFVENAVRHGIAPRAAGGTLGVMARRVHDRLELRVIDDGAGLPANYSERRARGSGIRNAEERLRALYGFAGRLEVSARAEGGVTVSMALPYHACPDSPAGSAPDAGTVL